MGVRPNRRINTDAASRRWLSAERWVHHSRRVLVGKME